RFRTRQGHHVPYLPAATSPGAGGPGRSGGERRGEGAAGRREAPRGFDGAGDLVVSDVVMPEMDGPTLLKMMRSRSPDLKIIFVSGYAEDAFEKSLPENEQFAFLPKPFTLTQLVAAVKETMPAG